MFAFIIKMPTMHRLSAFRDDIIFFIFLYQRWIYRVDKVSSVSIVCQIVCVLTGFCVCRRA